MVVVILQPQSLRWRPRWAPAAWLIAAAAAWRGVLGIHPVLILAGAALVMLASRRLMGPASSP